jgi:TPR repeat protein
MNNPQSPAASSEVTLREAAIACPTTTPGSEATLIETPDATNPAAVVLTAGFEIDGWWLRETIKVTSGEADLWVATGKDSQTAVVKVFRWGLRPKAEIEAKLLKVSRAQVVETYGGGVLPDGRHYEILEHIRHGTLADLGKGVMAPARVKEVLKELADAVEALHEVGILHRDLKPTNVLVRTVEPLDLVLTDFGISSLAELSLHATSAHRTAAYSAPEAMTGVVSRASDWWSIGVMVLELLRGAHPFAGLDERAVNFQLVMRGIEVPPDLAPDWALLIKGLLTRDHAKRWGAEHVRGWLEGKRNLTVHYTAAAVAVAGQRPYRFHGQGYGDAAGLAAALAEHWEEGVKHWGRGYVLQWVEKQLEDQDLAMRLHDVQDDKGLKGLETQLAAAALVMNPELPLSYKGELVTTGWLGGNWEAGRQVLESQLPLWLRRLRGEAWLEEAAKRCKEGMNYLGMAGLNVDTESAGWLLASGNRAVVDELVAERRRKYTASRKESLTALLRKEPLGFHEAVLLATVEEKELCTPEQILVEESLAWLDQQAVKYDRKAATPLILARDWGVLTPKWEARRQRVWLAKSPTLEKALAATAPEYLEAVLGATAEPECFWADAFEKGHAYLLGQGVQADPPTALKWLNQAAGEGDARAQTELGDCYYYGDGVAENKAEGVRWYRMAAEQYRLAAEQGNAAAQSNLGICYSNGKGVAENKVEGVRWYRLAAEQGNADAQCYLGACCASGRGVAQNQAEAVRWYRLAAEQGHALAQYSLGACYYDGVGVAKNQAEAVRWYRLAAEQGDAGVQFILGLCYDNGEGVAQNKVEAVRWYRLAAEQGDGSAQCSLGGCYDNGEGVAQNKVEAVRWYRLAAEQGYAVAQDALDELS